MGGNNQPGAADGCFFRVGSLAETQQFFDVGISAAPIGRIRVICWNCPTCSHSLFGHQQIIHKHTPAWHCLPRLYPVPARDKKRLSRQGGMYADFNPGRAHSLQRIAKSGSYATTLIITVHIEPIQISMSYIHISKTDYLTAV